VSTDPSGAAPLDPAGPAYAFDLDRPWRLDERVAVRPEPFGALLYHFGTRRLSFLKNTTMLAVVRSLSEHPSARAACTAAGVAPGSLAAYQRGLAVLAESHMITPRMVTRLAAG
jgi:mycofactocin biosynthesis protein MftB